MVIEGTIGVLNAYQTTPNNQTKSASKVEPRVQSEGVEKITVSDTESDVMAVNANKELEKDGSTHEDNQKKPSEDSVKQALAGINKKLNNTECIFGVHEKTNRVTIKIVEKESKKVLREFPPEKTLEMIAKAWELAGILVDEKL